MEAVQRRRGATVYVAPKYYEIDAFHKLIIRLETSSGARENSAQSVLHDEERPVDARRLNTACARPSNACLRMLSAKRPQCYRWTLLSTPTHAPTTDVAHEPAMATFNIIGYAGRTITSKPHANRSCRLPVELIREIVDNCDLKTVVDLRATSRFLAGHSEAILRQDRRDLLRPVCQNPDALWQHLRNAKAVVGGLAALSFILRDPSIRTTTVDVYVCNTEGDALEDLIAKDASLQLTLQQSHDWNVNDTHVDSNNVLRTTTYAAASGTTMKIHTSRTLSPLTPIATACTTALMNWVSRDAFACAYPALTDNRRALGSLPYGHHHTTQLLFNRLLLHGFSMKTHTAQWEDYANTLPPSVEPDRYPCARALYLCVDQGRFFGDQGCMVAVFELFSNSRRKLQADQQPPYGIGAAWRLITTHRPCNGPCVTRDPVLPRRRKVMLAVWMAAK